MDEIKNINFTYGIGKYIIIETGETVTANGDKLFVKKNGKLIEWKP